MKTLLACSPQRAVAIGVGTAQLAVVTHLHEAKAVLVGFVAFSLIGHIQEQSVQCVLHIGCGTMDNRLRAESRIVVAIKGHRDAEGSIGDAVKVVTVNGP